ncbi:hypothetical protein GCM10022409_16720 [Hymenobacter glaciei]|uniref:Uncharacterized protein n=2 Tax=Hymenobacter glaciei TaxID=877209 RepID=A0ABP7TYB3_9BACT
MRGLPSNGQSFSFYGGWADGSVDVKLLNLQEQTGVQLLNSANWITIYYDDIYSSWGGFTVGSDTGRVTINTINERFVQGTFTGSVRNMFGQPRLITNGEFAFKRGQ